MIDSTIITYSDSETEVAEQQHVFTSVNEARTFARLVASSFFMTELIYKNHDEEIIETFDHDGKWAAHEPI